MARPASSSRHFVSNNKDFKIKKGTSPVALQAINKKRQITE
jgi:hypothetical protein